MLLKSQAQMEKESPKVVSADLEKNPDSIELSSNLASLFGQNNQENTLLPPINSRRDNKVGEDAFDIDREGDGANTKRKSVTKNKKTLRGLPASPREKKT